VFGKAFRKLTGGLVREYCLQIILMDMLVRKQSFVETVRCGVSFLRCLPCTVLSPEWRRRYLDTAFP
jgi:hypothetical protein